MRRIVVLVVVALMSLGLAPSVAAAGPTHERMVFEWEFSEPAGGLCDFEYAQSGYGVNNVITWGDPAAPTTQIVNGPIVVTHWNSGTGYTLVEKASYTGVYRAGDTRQWLVGLYWHLRDADGKLVVVQAGQLLFDTSDGSLIKVTPNLNPDFAAVICPALGGTVP
jgi:hypothetical protein